MTHTYSTPEVQDIAVVSFLNGMEHAAQFARYQKAVGRIRSERMLLNLLNEQRHARQQKSFPRGQEGVLATPNHREGGPPTAARVVVPIPLRDKIALGIFAVIAWGVTLGYLMGY